MGNGVGLARRLPLLAGKGVSFGFGGETRRRLAAFSLQPPRGRKRPVRRRKTRGRAAALGEFLGLPVWQAFRYRWPELSALFARRDVSEQGAATGRVTARVVCGCDRPGAEVDAGVTPSFDVFAPHADNEPAIIRIHTREGPSPLQHEASYYARDDHGARGTAAGIGLPRDERRNMNAGSSVVCEDPLDEALVQPCGGAG